MRYGITKVVWFTGNHSTTYKKQKSLQDTTSAKKLDIMFLSMKYIDGGKNITAAWRT